MAALLQKPWVRVTLVAVLLLGTVALYFTQPWRLFLDRTVNEAGPVTVAPATRAAAPPEGSAAQATRPQVLSSGTFISHEHATKGRASIIRLADGKHILRIENLDTSDGPDLRVWLSDQPVKKGTSGWSVFDDGQHVELGELKGNKGDQNYSVPADTDLAELSSVSIWCKRFHVSFGAAALK
jgi:hypothetical protein